MAPHSGLVLLLLNLVLLKQEKMETTIPWESQDNTWIHEDYHCSIGSKLVNSILYKCTHCLGHPLALFYPCLLLATPQETLAWSTQPKKGNLLPFAICSYISQDPWIEKRNATKCPSRIYHTVLATIASLHKKEFWNYYGKTVAASISALTHSREEQCMVNHPFIYGYYHTNASHRGGNLTGHQRESSQLYTT